MFSMMSADYGRSFLWIVEILERLAADARKKVVLFSCLSADWADKNLVVANALPNITVVKGIWKKVIVVF